MVNNNLNFVDYSNTIHSQSIQKKTNSVKSCSKTALTSKVNDCAQAAKRSLSDANFQLDNSNKKSKIYSVDSNSSIKLKTKWSKQEDDLLIQEVEKYKNKQQISWVEINVFLPNRKERECRNRWVTLSRETFGSKNSIATSSVGSIVSNYNIKIKSEWSEEEKTLLIQELKKYKNENQISWVKVSAAIPNRTNIECKNKWSTLSKTNLEWSQEEDDLLVKQIANCSDGVICWKKIAKNFPKRHLKSCQKRWEEISDKDFTKQVLDYQNFINKNTDNYPLPN